MFLIYYCINNNCNYYFNINNNYIINYFIRYKLNIKKFLIIKCYICKNILLDNNNINIFIIIN